MAGIKRIREIEKLELLLGEKHVISNYCLLLKKKLSSKQYRKFLSAVQAVGVFGICVFVLLCIQLLNS
jgi:hypothetical protein